MSVEAKIVTRPRTEKDSSTGATLNDVLVRNTEHLHDASQLLLLVFTWEDWEPCVELGQNAPKAPHVDSHAIAHAKDDFGRAVKAALDIRIYCGREQVSERANEIHKPFSCSRQLLPKSMTLMPLFAGCRNRIF